MINPVFESQNEIQKVFNFQTVFELYVNHAPSATIPENIYQLRHRLMEEENNEYLLAAASGNLVEIADALGDKLYILPGTIIWHGLQDIISEVFDEIHKSNMSKLDENGHPVLREDGKILKSKLYFKQDIGAIFENHCIKTTY
jgi:predicted HAD superfamily Cof-like phosphohydrolase